jgi:7-cyano-7-deazaguanine synthase
VTGVCETDYSGYPDCRTNTIDALTRAIELGNECPFTIFTPLMNLTKKKTVEMAWDLGLDCWKALGKTVTCYHGKRPGCGECPACLLRAKGFAEAGRKDPQIDPVMS